MIVLRFKAQLGNQMFQYAAVRCLAEQAGEPLVVVNRYNQLHHVFGLGRSKPVEVLKTKGLLPLLSRFGFQEFSPPYVEGPGGISAETLIEKLPPKSIVSGWFQSDRYFRARRSEVCSWYTPRPPYVRRAEEIVAQTGRPASEICVIHLRFGDFYVSDEGYGHPVLGWVLPIDYYRAALSRLPAGLKYLVISDMPGRARQWLDFLPDLTVIEREAAGTDLWLLTLAKYLVVSNSTFAWWGAWLNNVPGKQVYAPEFFNGWWAGSWIPRDIEVEGWHYIPRAETVRRVQDWR